MGRLPYFLAVILLVRSVGSISGPSVKWEFGQDSYDLQVMNQLSGKITSDKITRVSIPTSSCMEIKYVHVELWNTLSTPEVQFNRNTNTVTITYKLLQSVLSNYDIVAKGRKSPQCGGSVGNHYNNGYNNHNNGYYNEYQNHYNRHHNNNGHNHNNGYHNPNNGYHNHNNGYHNHNNGPNNNNKGRYFNGGGNNGYRGGHNGNRGGNNGYRGGHNGNRGGNNGHRGSKNGNRGRYLSSHNGLGFGGDNNGNYNGNKGGRGSNSPGSGWGRGNG